MLELHLVPIPTQIWSFIGWPWVSHYLSVSPTAQGYCKVKRRGGPMNTTLNSIEKGWHRNVKIKYISHLWYQYVKLLEQRCSIMLLQDSALKNESLPWLKLQQSSFSYLGPKIPQADPQIQSFREQFPVTIWKKQWNKLVQTSTFEQNLLGT